MFDISRFEKSKEEFTLFIKVSEYCNIKCNFCYQNAPDGEMLNTDEKIKTCLSNIDLWIEKLMKIREVEERKNNLGAIVMFGGEPTVNPKAIEIICKHLEENHKDKRQFLRITMTTNGTIYNEQITSNLFKAFNKKVGIMVSCDGSETESDLNRKFKSDNTSVFKKVQLNIEKYKKDKNVYNLLLASVH
ncbi:MAG: radical SAM protein, partial [Fusobacteriaceae bacterium]